MQYAAPIHNPHDHHTSGKPPNASGQWRDHGVDLPDPRQPSCVVLAVTAGLGCLAGTFSRIVHRVEAAGLARARSTLERKSSCIGSIRLAIVVLMGTMLMEALPVIAAAAPGLIFDTDICGDCDDVLALGMIHALQSRGACKLLAVTVSVDNDLAAPFVDAVNTFYGRGDIPIGVVGKGGVVEQSKYLGLVEQKETDGRFRYPHKLLSGKDAPPATQVLRKVLAAQPDHSVVIAQVGFSTNLARLLDSGPDEYSPLSGIELVKLKVKLLSLMAGAFQPIEGNEQYLEYNVVRDIPSCQKLGRALADSDGLQRLRDRHRAALSRGQHRARLRLRAAPPAGRGLYSLYPTAAQPADLGPDRRALRSAR